ncbi:hypothetical protein GGQ74_001073 [Desulfobaculum xiamenense]|uniref:FeS-binding protein n=1 Tax=Desulfobaculum xiamenense TaxID=995050 RepID=A0A846QMH2_9BACT|nr:FeS-binding protein [Desulfobaculum xiamenense]NJB67433.1 hypothetical protein [Desulfobaculum xiamenense]
MTARSCPKDGCGWMRWLYLLACWTLAVSGMAQMPIFKRYYIADIPGFGWTADFVFTHAMHYAAAAVFLALAFHFATRFALERGWRLTVTGWLRTASIALLIGTGVVRVLKNMPDVSFSPMTVMLIDWGHLAAAVLLGVFALVALVGGRIAYRADGERNF